MHALRALVTGHHRVSPIRTVCTAVVCLAAGTVAGVQPQFVANVRRRPWRSRKLVDCWQVAHTAMRAGRAEVAVLPASPVEAFQVGRYTFAVAAPDRVTDGGDR